MNDSTRERELIETFASLADTLVDDYDVVELLQTLVEKCRTVLAVDAVGLLLAEENGYLELVASTSESSRLVELMQLSAEAGPCIEAFVTARVVSLPDIADAPPEWSQFAATSLEQGFHSVVAVPLRLRSSTIGSLNLLKASVGELDERDVRAAQALADVATIGILHERALRASTVLQEQLQIALNSRVVIEQAKGVLAQTHRIDPEQAFTLLRNYARSNQRPLAEVALELVQRTLIF